MRHEKLSHQTYIICNMQYIPNLCPQWLNYLVVINHLNLCFFIPLFYHSLFLILIPYILTKGSFPFFVFLPFDFQFTHTLILISISARLSRSLAFVSLPLCACLRACDFMVFTASFMHSVLSFCIVFLLFAFYYI